MTRLGLILFCCLSPGCVIVQTGVTNPVRGLRTVAVAPFINHSAQPNHVVDGRRFAMAYYSELQKVPGFEVVPVGVTETAMLENGLDFSTPEDALRLARLLDVDAVVVGSITEYDPYYPPRLGLHVQWLSPSAWTFLPSLPVHPEARRRTGKYRWTGLPAIPEAGRATELSLPGTMRAQSPGPFKRHSSQPADQFLPPVVIGSDPADAQKMPTDAATALPPSAPSRSATLKASTASRMRQLPGADPPANAGGLPVRVPASLQSPAIKFDPTEPVMSYSRIFDGTDADLLATLRDYVELNGDLRSGSWQAYLHRSDDFIRFAAHRMIVEMLTLHGGEGRRRIVLKWRKHK